MNLSKCKRWRALLHRMVAKQQAKRKQSSCVFTRSGKVKKVENVNTQNDCKTMGKKIE